MLQKISWPRHVRQATLPTKDNDDQALVNSLRNNNTRKARKYGGINDVHMTNSGCRDKGGGRDGGGHGNRGRYLIQEYENMHHNCRGCHLNWHTRLFDSRAGTGKRFYISERSVRPKCKVAEHL